MSITPRRASEYPDNKLEFLMSPYIYRGLITVLSGIRSSNKSTLAAFMAAKLSRGQNPFNAGSIRAGTTLFYGHEDDVKSVKSERIKHFGGDENRILYSEAYSIDDETQMEDDFKFAKPDLVVIDTLSSFFGSSLGEKRINTALTFLTQMAAEYNCAIFIVHHPKNDPRTLDDVLSGAERIGNFARVVYYLQRDMERKDRRYFATAFTRYGKEPYTLHFRINHEFRIDKMTVAKHLSCQDVLNLRRPDKNHCAVAALASAARIEPQKAEWLYREAGRQRWRGTPRSISERVLRQFGTLTIAPKQKPYLTLGQFIQENRKGHFIVAVPRHQLAVNDGKPSDATGRKTRVQEYWKLFK